MSDSQIFQAFGLLFLFIGLSSLINGDIYKKVLEGFTSNLGLYFLTGMSVLLLGFIMVTFHNVWESKLTVIITILGWMSLLKGTIMIVLPEWTIGITKKAMKAKFFMAIFKYPILVLGLIFLIMGYL